MKTCKKCGAIYKPQEWEKGFLLGTASDFVPIIRVRYNQCPVCLTEDTYEPEPNFISPLGDTKIIKYM